MNEKFSSLMVISDRMLVYPLKKILSEKIDCDNELYNDWSTAYLENKPLPIKNITDKSIILVAKALSEGIPIKLIKQFARNELPHWLLVLTENKDLFKKDELKDLILLDKEITIDYRNNIDNLKTLFYWDSTLKINVSMDTIHPFLLKNKNVLKNIFSTNKTYFDNTQLKLINSCLSILETYKSENDLLFIDQLIYKEKLNGLTFKDFYRLKDNLLFIESDINDSFHNDNYTALLIAYYINKLLSNELIDSSLNNITVLAKLMGAKQYYYQSIDKIDIFNKELNKLEEILLKNPYFTVEHFFVLCNFDSFVYDSSNIDLVAYYSLFENHKNKWIDLVKGFHDLNIHINKDNVLYFFEKHYFDVYVKNKTITIENNEDLSLNL